MTRRVAVAAGLALAVLLPFAVPTYFVDILSRVLVFAVLAMGLNLLAGYAGLPSLGQAAFMAVGAYTAALLIRRLDVGFVAASIAGVALAAALVGDRHPVARLVCGDGARELVGRRGLSRPE